MQPAPDLSHIAGDLSQWSLVRNLSVRGYSGRLYRLGTALVNRRMRQVITILVVSDPVNDRRKIAKFAYVSQDIMAYRRLVICCCGISEEEERAMSGMSLIAIRVPEPMCHHGDRGRGAYSIARDLILSSQEDRARAVRLKRSRTRVVLDILSFIRDAGRAVSITQITDACNLNHSISKRILEEMARDGLILSVKNGSKIYYEISERGNMFIELLLPIV